MSYSQFWQGERAGTLVAPASFAIVYMAGQDRSPLFMCGGGAECEARCVNRGVATGLTAAARKGRAVIVCMARGV